jgi:hydroxyethylthiazole kinase-like uncharacterized protein yjeF
MRDVLLTAAQMRAAEATAIGTGATTGADLMERAGQGAVEAILSEWPDMATVAGRAVVLCGPGNNGGDGYVVARALAMRGWTVHTLAVGDAEAMPQDARANRRLWEAAGRGGTVAVPGGTCELIVDALFGTGLSRPIDDPAILDWLEHIDSCTRADARTGTSQAGTPGSTRTVALDVPSGLDADSGRVLGDGSGGRRGCARTMLTVAFGAVKLGHVLREGPEFSGALRVVDLGLSEPQDGSVVRRLAGAPNLTKTMGHKYDHGHALVLTGGLGRTGAARLAARAALRIGAGLVTLGAPGSAMMECAAQITALMLRRCEDAGGLRDLLADGRLNALCLGPGLGTDARAEELVAAAVASARPTALDADALTVLAGATGPSLHGACVLTPHMGEFARLFPDLSERLGGQAAAGPAFSKVDAAREAAMRAGCVLVLKGPDTVIAAPDGQASVSDAVRERAVPWMATAGSGDVLAGMIVGLMARGLTPFDAACAAVPLHVEAARAFGPGLIAEDLPEMLPHVLASSGPEGSG